MEETDKSMDIFFRFYENSERFHKENRAIYGKRSENLV